MEEGLGGGGKEGGEVSRSQVGGVENKRGWLRHRGGDELKQTGEANDHPAGQQGAAKRGGGIVSETSGKVFFHLTPSSGQVWMLITSGVNWED